MSNSSRYYHFDHQGTTQALTDGGGAVTDRFASDAWGVQVKRTGSSNNKLEYLGNGGYYAAGSMPIYVRARWLDVPGGGWLSGDPSAMLTRAVPRLVREEREELTSRLQEPLYAYALANPARFDDPAGLSARAYLICMHGGEAFCSKPASCWDYCTVCAKTEGFRTLSDYCTAIDSWAGREPKVPLLPAMACALFNRPRAQATAGHQCRNAGGLFDKCIHCVTAGEIAKGCGDDAARWASWCQEMMDLTDCNDSNFEVADDDVARQGIIGSKYSSCDAACRYLGAMK